MSDITSRQPRARATARRGTRHDATQDISVPADQMVTPEQSYLPWLAAVLMLAIVSPVWFYIGGFLITPTRLVCLLAVPILGVRLFFQRAYGKLLIIDWLILFYSGWVMLSYMVTSGMGAFVYASLTTMNILGGYLVGRAAIRHAGHLQGAARLMVIVVTCLLPFAIWEGIYADYVIPEWIKSIPGLSSVKQIDYGRRLGIDRAQVVFAHPIHYGLYCSLALSLYFVGLSNQVLLGKRLLVAAIIIGACFMSVSSGPLFTLIFQMMLIFYMLFFQHLKNHWKTLLYWTGGIYIVLELISNRFALYAIASRIAFNSGTAYYRQLIWEYGTAQVERTPIFGVGVRPWAKPFWMSDSIDNYWLQIAVTSGMPASFAMIAVFLISMFRAGRGTYVQGSDAYNMRVGWTILFVGLSLSLATVTIWNEVLSMVMFLIGAGAYMLQAERPQEAGPFDGRRAKPKRTSSALSDVTGTVKPEPRKLAYTRFPSDSHEDGAGPKRTRQRR